MKSTNSCNGYAATVLLVLSLWTAVGLILSLPKAAETKAVAAAQAAPAAGAQALLGQAHALAADAHNTLLHWAGIPAGLLLIASALIGMFAGIPAATKRIILAFWTVAPAIYLYLEYRVFWDRLSNDHLEALRHFQDLTRNIWISCLAVLAAIYRVKLGGGEP